MSILIYRRYLKCSADMFYISRVKKLISFILVICLVAPMLMRNAVLISFFMHREKIAKELCIEKDNEKSCCKGSCQLKKELNKVEKEAGESTIPATGKIEILWDHYIAEYSYSAFFDSAPAELDVYLEMQSQADLPANDRPPSC